MKFLDKYFNFLKENKYGKIIYQVESLLVALLVALIIRQFVIATFKIPSSSMENTLMTGDFLVGSKFNWGAKIPFVNRKLPAISDIERGNIVIFKSPYPPYLDFIKRCVAVSGDTLEYKNKQLYINGIQRNMHKDGKRVSAQFLDFRDEFSKIVVPSVGDTMKLIDGDIKGNIFFVNLLKQEFPDSKISTSYSFFINDRKENIININGQNISPKDIGCELGTFETPYKYMQEIHKIKSDSTIKLLTTVQKDGQDIDKFIIQSKCYFMMGDNRDNSADSRFWGFVSDRNILAKPLMVLYSFSPAGYKRIGTLIE